VSHGVFIEVPSETAGMSARRFLPLSPGARDSLAAAEPGYANMAAPPLLPAARRAVAPIEANLRSPVERAYGFLNFVMDAYAQGDTLRLLQSYNNESGLLTTGFVYDNALAVIAYLSRPTPEHVRRARILGDSLLFAQTTDVSHDGRVRQAYFTGPLVWYGGGPLLPGFRGADGAIPAYLFGFTGTSTGDAAWVGLAFAHLYAHTGERRYLAGAVAIGDFISRTATSAYHFGGYTGGLANDGTSELMWSSTEHNIDVYGFFEMLALLSGQQSWHTKAKNALGFVQSMWNAAGGFFFTGTQNPGAPYPDPSSGLAALSTSGDPNRINTSQVSEDVQTWSYLCLAEQEFRCSLEWAAAELATTDAAACRNSELPVGYSVSGVTFSDRSKQLAGPVPGGTGNNDRDAVWLEGTAHLAAALTCRDGAERKLQAQRRGKSESRDRGRAMSYLASIVSAQNKLGSAVAALTSGPARCGQTVGLTARANGALSDPGEGGTWTGVALPPRSGIVAASSGFDTGYGFGYFQCQHVGATSWFLLAALGVNPFRL
jgi:hypothetical protein